MNVWRDFSGQRALLLLVLGLVGVAHASTTVTDTFTLQDALTNPPSDGIIYMASNSYVLCNSGLGGGGKAISLIGLPVASITCSIPATYIFNVNNEGAGDALVNLQLSASPLGVYISNSSISLTNMTFATMTQTSLYVAQSGQAFVLNIRFIASAAGPSICVGGNITGQGLMCTGINSYNGGCMYMNAGSRVSLSNSVFAANGATNNGGAIFAVGGASLTLINSTFTGNHANGGGGAIQMGTNNPRSSIVLTNVLFDSNYANLPGGGALQLTYADATITGCTFNGNRVNTADNTYGGGAIQLQHSTAFISQTNFTANSAASNAGAIHVSVQSSAVLVDCTLRANTVTQSGPGGAVMVTDQSVVNATRARFQGNLCTNGNGGAIYLNGFSFLFLVDSVLLGNTVSIPNNNNGGAIGLDTAYVTAISTTIQNNIATAGGGVYVANSVSYVNISAGAFLYNTATGGGNSFGGAIYTQNAPLTITGSVLRGNLAYIGGGAIRFVSTTLVVRDTQFTQNMAQAGGAIHSVDDGATLTVRNGTFMLNQATFGAGAAVYFGGGSTSHLTVAGSTFISNNISLHDRPGAAMWLSCTDPPVVSDSTFIDNRHEGADFLIGGGAIYAENRLIVINSVFDRNNASVGGSVYSNDVATIIGSTFRNHNTSYGSALLCVGGCTINGSTFLNNVAFSSMTANGAVFCGGQACLISNSSFTGNLALKMSGGAVNCVSNVCSFYQSNFTSNYGYLSSGAISFSASAAISIVKCIFTRNSVNQPSGVGGALYINGGVASFTIDQSAFAENLAFDGGSIFVDNTAAALIVGSQFCDNVAVRNGGGMYCGQGTFCTVSGSTFIGNSANNEGGGVYGKNVANFIDVFDSNFNSNTATNLGGGVASYSPLRIQRTTFSQNVVTDADGGGVHVEGPSFISVGLRFIANSAVCGGGVFCRANTALFSNHTFQQNVATVSGAGVNIFLPTTFTVNNTLFDRNEIRAPNTETCVQGGGMLALLQTGTFVLSRLRFVNNLATTGGFTSGGGGLYLILQDLPQLQLTDLEFEGNQAQNGGGLMIDSSCYSAVSLSLPGVIFSNNYATGSGGGLYIRSVGSICHRVIACNFTSNSAGTGGGLATDTGGQISDNGSRFSFNTADNGGAIYVVGSGLQSTGSVFRNNSALTYGGAIGVTSNGMQMAVDIEHAIFSGNSAGLGGGVALWNYKCGVNCCLETATFIANSASVAGGGLFTEADSFQVSYANYLGNQAAMGGGVAVGVGSTLTITGGLWQNNFAADSGGAISSDVYATVVCQDCVATGNSAVNQGGAVYSSYVSQRCQLLNVTLTNNWAPLGGAVYVAEANYQGPFAIKDSVLSGNSASDSGGAVFAAGQVALNSSTLSQNAAVNDGGGVFAEDVVMVTGTFFDRNTAAIGGGMYCDQCTATMQSNKTRFVGNAVTQSGPAFTCQPGSAFSIDAAVYFGANPNLAAPTDLRVADCDACGCCALPNLASINISSCLPFPSRTCNYSCVEGYDTAPGGQFTCSPGPQLNPPSICLRQRCATALGAPLNGYLDADADDFTGAVVGYHCDDGFILVGALNATCAGRNWVINGAPPVCQGLPCNPPLVNPFGGSWSRVNGTTGDSAMLTCGPGFLIIGSAVSTCQADGTWSNRDQPCNQTACPALTAPAAGTHLHLSRLTGGSGDIATYTCDAEYGISGNPTLYCNGVAWNSTVEPTCIGLPCYRIADPANGTLTYLDQNAVTVPAEQQPALGDQMICTCNAGFAATGTITRLCVAPPDWSGTPCVCTLSRCHVDPNGGAVVTCPATVDYLGTCAGECPAGTGASAVRVDNAVCSQLAVNDPVVFEPALPTCVECVSNSYSPGNQVGCTPCPNGGTTADRGATQQAQCSCLEGFYELNADQGDCTACPVGATCAGQRAQPKAARGYFSTGDGFVACAPSAACVGENQCGTGYTGFLCGACDAHFYRLNGNCEACPNDVWWRILVAVIVALGLAYGLVVIVRPSEIGERSYGFASATIGLSFIQIVATFADLRVPWPAKTRELFAVFSFLNLNIELASPECIATFTFWQKFQLQMSVPLIVAALMFLLWIGWTLVTWLAEKRPPFIVVWRHAKRIAKVIAGAYLFFLTVAYLLLADATLSIFACKKTGDKYTVVGAATEYCYEGEWSQNLPIAIVGIILYIVFIPFLILGFYYVIRARYGAFVATRSTFANYLVKKYEPNRWYWEAITMMRKLTVVVVATLFYDNAYLQVALSSAVFFFCCVATLVYRPYRWKKHNLLEVISMIGSLIVLFCGQMSGSPLYGPIQQEVLSVIAILTVVVTLGCIAACFLLEVNIFYTIFTLYRKLFPEGDLQIASTPAAAVSVLCAEDSVFVVAADGVVRGHNSRDLTPTISLAVNRAVTSAALTDHELVVAGGTLVEAWSLELRTCMRRGEVPAGIRSMAASARGVATGCADGSVQFWRVPTFAQGHRDTMQSLSAIDLDRILEGEVTENPIHARDSARASTMQIDRWGDVKTLAGHTGPVTAIYAVDDFAFSGSSDGCIKKWSMAEGALLREWALPAAAGTLTALLETGTHLIAGDVIGAIYVIDLAGVQPMQAFRAQTARISSLSVQGENLAVGSTDGSVLLYSAESVVYRQTLTPESGTPIGGATIDPRDSTRCFWADGKAVLTVHEIKSAWHLRDFDPLLESRAWRSCLLRCGMVTSRNARSGTVSSVRESLYDELDILSRDINDNHDRASTYSLGSISGSGGGGGAGAMGVSSRREGFGENWTALSGNSAVVLNQVMARQSARQSWKET